MYVPPGVVSNDALARIMETSDEWIRQRTGIEERRYARPGEASSDMAVPAARDAIANAGLKPEDIDYMVFATMTPDVYFPGSGPFLQRKLGLGKIPCLDIRQQCAGFIYALQMGDALIRAGSYRNVLVVGAEVHSCFMPWKSWHLLDDGVTEHASDEEKEANTRTRDRTVLFGDGAGVVVLSAEDGERGILDVLIRADGDEAEKLWTPAGGSAYRPYFDPSMSESGAVTPVVEGRDVYKLATRYMPEITNQILEQNGLTIDDVDLVVMHQANLRINEAVQKRLKLPDEKVFNNIQRYANTTAATIPLAFHEARQAGRVKDGDLVCFVGLGSGLNWGAVLHRC